MSDQPGRTSLTPFAASMRDADPDGPARAARAARAAREAWLEHGILVVFPGQLHGLDREFTVALGNRLWGIHK